MTGLRPGEIKIIRALSTGRKKNSELQNETRLNSTVLSEYLKNLQNLKIVTRDFNDRKYEVVEQLGWEALFFNDLLEFQKERFDKAITVSKEKAGLMSDLALGWLVLADNVDTNYLQGLKEVIRRRSHVLNELGDAVQELWDSYILSTYEEKERNTIKEYKEKLLEYVKLHMIQKDEKTRIKHEEEIYKFVLPGTIAEVSMWLGSGATANKSELALAKQLVDKKAMEKCKQYVKMFEGFDDACLQPWDLRDLDNKLAVLRQQRLFKDELTMEETTRLQEIKAFLENSRNKSLFKVYREKSGNQTKTLITYASFGFKGYRKKIENMFGDSLNSFQRGRPP